MNDSNLYAKILGLRKPWRVLTITVSEALKTITVFIGPEPGSRLRCPHCRQICPGYDSRARRWRHLDTCEYQTWIEADVPRVQCPEHGCVQVGIAWAGSHSRYTKKFEMMVLDWLRETTILAVSRRLGLSWSAIDGILRRAVTRGIDRRRVANDAHICVDEVAFAKGRDYVTIVSSAQRVLAVEDGRAAESLRRYFKVLGRKRCERLESVSMDMSGAYIKAALDSLPDAREKVAFDHFHVAKALSEAVDNTRKSELHRVDYGLRREIHRSRYDWLRRGTHLSDFGRERMQALSVSLLDTAMVWMLKEKAREIWHTGYHPRQSAKTWQVWIQAARQTGITALRGVANQIEARLWGILNAMRLRVSNARAEALNSQIRAMRVKARGYRNKARFMLGILFHYGKLNMAH
ncbi:MULTISPECIES: ISL3 family transposase [Achromobacter]|uniref:ISL3 family transposase n=1 Tax=Achromobacter TaxID=222 RepID=UPI0012DD7836|nr:MULTISPECIES: ISL3 family transposase [Achromobacter]MBB1625962.1 transposase [Achromobacter sp. UMC71]MBB1628308.1 transposase [Achromobacter sp. UMC71]